MANKGIIPTRLTAATVRSYIDFDGHAAGGQPPSLQELIQSEGVAGLWELLRKRGHAYLGDEVGMGKTRQAMGVIATQFLEKPDSRVVIVCPSRTVQVQWQGEWAQFLRSCYRLLDDRLLATADASQIENLHLHDRLSDLHEALRIGEGRIHLLRYSSFSWSLRLDGTTPEDMLAHYAREVRLAGVHELTEAERALAAQHARPAPGWQDELGLALSRAWCQRIGVMLTDGTRPTPDGGVEAARPIDLAVFDEAQYLRHLDNLRSDHIRQMFGHNVDKWLFLSATPLHSGEADLHSLDAYLCHRRPVVYKHGWRQAARIPEDCGSCAHAARCSRVKWQLGPQREVVDILNDLMIRRTRTYGDGDRKRHGKLEYRQHVPARHSGADDPFLALPMALVQKRLVTALAGRNNRFRQGECASFESLSSSLGRYEGPDGQNEFEAARDHRAPRDVEAAPDRNAIDELNRSFTDAMKLPGGIGLPHAKVAGTVRELSERSLVDGSTDKTLVFVRRVDTVEELRDQLHMKFQQELDKRIEAWQHLLKDPAFGASSDGWEDSLWEQQGDVDDARSSASAHQDDGPATDDVVGNVRYRDAVSLPYFDALKQSVKGRKGPGVLFVFRSKLLRADERGGNPLQRFLLKQAAGNTTDRNRERWERMLVALFGAVGVQQLRADPAHAWLFSDSSGDDADAYKLASLQLCLLQSLRQTEFLVDLFILHRYVKSTPDGARLLPDKLLWVLEATDGQLPAKIARYIENEKERLRRWILHFDLIVDKCFRRGEAADWTVIHDKRIVATFARMAPVVGRSGRMKNDNAVPQFMFPGHPNILICTDVLKEGVDMHLFCDRVVHYGVAWTSGDLEQRIGRVDRLGGLVGRRIARHTALEGKTLPRLEVEFPYLDGTLDMHQVRNVIREKIISDQRLDLGRRKAEIREFDAGQLISELPLHAEQGLRLPEDGVVFFPADVRFVRDERLAEPLRLAPGMRYKNGTDTVRPQQLVDDRSPETVVPIDGCDAVLVRRPALGGHVLARRSLDPVTRDMLLTEDCVTLRSGSGNVPAVGMEAVRAGIHAVDAIGADGFAFDGAVNTCVLWVDWNAGSARLQRHGGTPVLVEMLGERFWLLRAPVQRTEDFNALKGGVTRWMAESNSGRTLGFLMQDAGIVWCAAVIVKTEGKELPLLAQLAPRLARMTTRWRLPGAVPATFGYRAWTSFPRVEQDTVWKDNMKQSDVVNCGRVLAGVQAWLGEAFEKVFGELCAAEGRTEGNGLRVLPMALLPGGVLHLRTEGRERFGLQAFLDPTGASAGAGTLGGPAIWWELVASPNAQGARPEMQLSDIDQFPHVAPHLWRGEFDGGIGAFTAWNERDYRCIAFCHSPADWDHSRDALLAAWKDVRQKLRTGTKFQHQWCRDMLRAAVAPALPDAPAYGT